VLVARVLVLVGLSSVAPLEKGDVKVVAAMFHATPKKSKRARGGRGRCWVPWCFVSLIDQTSKFWILFAK
jgi:hypothetical protein